VIPLITSACKDCITIVGPALRGGPVKIEANLIQQTFADWEYS
jgi:hypothetical protein